MQVKTRRTGFIEFLKRATKTVDSWPQWKRDVLIPVYRQGEVVVGNVCASRRRTVGVVTSISTDTRGRKTYCGRQVKNQRPWQSVKPVKLARTTEEYKQVYQR